MTAWSQYLLCPGFPRLPRLITGQARRTGKFLYPICYTIYKLGYYSYISYTAIESISIAQTSKYSRFGVESFSRYA